MPDPAVASRPRGHLPRLPDAAYRGRAVVFWTHTLKQRTGGWLTANFHATFREILLHASVREGGLLCPVYVLMPDHLHLIWMGACETADQRSATRFVRRQRSPHLRPHAWQHQPFDRVLRPEERRKHAFASMCSYVSENPVRANLVERAAQWPYAGCIVAGYPTLHPLQEDFWAKFWAVYQAAVEGEDVWTSRRKRRPCDHVRY